MIEIATHRNISSGITTLEFEGALTIDAIPPVRKATGKAAAECPAAVLADLSGLREAVPSLLSVFATATVDARRSWGVPLLVCAPNPQVRGGLAAFRQHLAVYETRAQASLAAQAHVPLWAWKRLPPAPTTARTARDVVGDACDAWGLSHLREAARLVASELAANAIRHARTDYDITVSFTGTYLRVAVRDGSHAPPRPPATAPKTSVMPPGGRGLHLIGRLSTHFGHVDLPDGKIVWALLRAAS
ncbi:ATP-binding protein [Actinoplanes sp. CA-030573]|uniref:ATP-binding protein n=1 Tax=Actinoplanes sp. CA-030573 TaxID=3239898 RepID=UPI003D93DB99